MADSALKALLAELDREQLETLLLEVVAGDVRLVATIEQRVADLNRRPASTVPPRPPVDLNALRVEIRSIMGSSASYGYGSGVVDPVSDLVARVWEAIKAGDGDQALAMLEIITEPYTKGWYEFDDSDGELGAYLEQIGEAWTEAIVTANLSKMERQALAKQLDKWDTTVAEYGVDVAFGAAIEAAKQGWDHPWVVRVLQGDVEEPPEDSTYRQEVGAARVNVLERQGRFQEGLWIAEACGLTERYVTMLVKLGRVEEAVDEALQQFTSADAMLTLAMVLWGQGERERALQIAEQGLTLQIPRTPLATWLRDMAVGVGRAELAMAASMVAYRELRSLEAYLKVAELAGEAWPLRRDELLDLARKAPSYFPHGPVDIFLHEGLIADAIAIVDGGATHTLVERVVDAALPTHPDWVIQTCRRQAESIMDATKAKYYAAAAQWLARAQAAYQSSGRAAEWQAYRAELLVQHARKRNLVPLLQDLG
jgi:uncharacterized Zn finger protein